MFNESLWLNSFWITVSCSVLHFISQGNKFNECCFIRMSAPLRNLYKCRQVLYCYFCILFTLSLQCCCCLFTSLSLFLDWCYCYTYIHNWPLKHFRQEVIITSSTWFPIRLFNNNQCALVNIPDKCSLFFNESKLI